MAVTLATLSTASSIDLDSTNLALVGGVAAIGVVALALGVVLRQQVIAAGAGTERMQEIAGAVEEGAHAYLRRQFRTLVIFVALVFVLLLLLPADSAGVRWGRSGFFVLGAAFSAASSSSVAEASSSSSCSSI
mgnify:CR=1 FL=1